MAYYNTIPNQITAIIPKHEFDSLAEQHHSGQKFRSFNRWSQFMAMIIGQLSGRKSLRDITDNLKAQHSKLYHLGIKKTSRATLARVNEKQPSSLYESLFINFSADVTRLPRAINFHSKTSCIKMWFHRRNCSGKFYATAVNFNTGFRVNTPEGAALRIRYLLYNRVKAKEIGDKAKEFVRVFDPNHQSPFWSKRKD